jgi:WD40 repeat protein
MAAGLLGHRIAVGLFAALACACACQQQAHAQRVSAAAFSPDRKLYALGDTDKVVAVRDLETRKRLQTLQGHTGEISALAFSPDGKTIATASDAEDDPIRLWDAATGKETRALRWMKKGGAKGEGRAFVTRVTSLEFSPDGKLLAAAGNVVTYPYAEPQKIDREYAGTIHLWDVAAGKVAQTLTAGKTDIGHASFSPDGRFIVSGSGDDDRAKAGVKVWDAATGKLVRTLADSYEYHDAVSVRVSPDGRHVAAADTQSGALWDMNSGARLRELDAGGHLAFSPDGKYVANGASSAFLWDVSTGEKLRTLGGYSGAPNALAFTDGGKTLLIGGWDNKFRVWDAATGQEKTPAAGN